MANGADEGSRHFILDGVTETEPFRSPQQGGGRPTVPGRDRERHGGTLRRQLDELHPQAEAAKEAQLQAGIDEGLGLMIEFESFPDIDLAFESLARERSGIELLNFRRDGNRMCATVFVPDGKLVHFENLIRDYLAEKRDSIGRPRDNRRLIDAIREIRAASLRALWTDTDDSFPTEDEEAVWWEVWLPVRTDRTVTVDAFRKLAEAQGIRVAPGTLSFPERTVLLASASVEQMQRSMLTLNSIAELRRAKETADFFDSLDPAEQGEWIDDLLNRSAFVEDARNVAHVCLLDTGVNRGHPLLTPALASSDLHTVEPAWGDGDDFGHGTEMAGCPVIPNVAVMLAAWPAPAVRPSTSSTALSCGGAVTGEVGSSSKSWPPKNSVTSRDTDSCLSIEAR